MTRQCPRDTINWNVGKNEKQRGETVVEKTMAQVQHFIWDLDGTLLDTYPAIISDLRAALREFGHDCDPVEAMELMLVNISNAARHYAKKFGLDYDTLMDVYHGIHNKTISGFTAKPMEGAKEVLEKICKSGRHNYIFTHRKDWETVEYLKKYGLDVYFRDIVGQDSPQFAFKPAPDAVLYLMEKYGMEPENTVMVGDRDCDLSSGRNAGIGTVHYVCAIVPETLNCDWRVESFSQMLEML